MKKFLFGIILVLLASTVTAIASYDFGSYSGELHPWIHGFASVEPQYDYYTLNQIAASQRWYPEMADTALAYDVKDGYLIRGLQIREKVDAGFSSMAQAIYVSELAKEYSFSSVPGVADCKDKYAGYAFYPSGKDCR